jgi:hypothetical protein
MNKIALLVALAIVSFTTAAMATGDSNPNIGCGFGSTLFSGKTTKIPLILGATTNGMFTQTFGISSDTAGCTSRGGWVKNEKKQAVYAEVNLQKLSAEMAQGGGEYLSAFASLMGANDAASKQAFFKLTQSHYETLFPAANTDSAMMLSNLRAVMAADPKLATL